MDKPPRDRGVVVALFAAAMSGAISGFFIAGHLILSAAVFVTMFVGAALGWCARGLASSP